MIDFESYEEFKLEDIADFERAKPGYVYPAWSSTIQISATKGQIGFLYQPTKVHSKEVVVTPQAGIDKRYFNIIMRKNVDSFMSKYATGLNVQEKEVANFPIQLHNLETQQAIVKMYDYIESKEIEAVAEMEQMQVLKRTMLSMMMV